MRAPPMPETPLGRGRGTPRSSPSPRRGEPDMSVIAGAHARASASQFLLAQPLPARRSCTMTLRLLALKGFAATKAAMEAHVCNGAIDGLVHGASATRERAPQTTRVAPARAPDAPPRDLTRRRRFWGGASSV